MALNVAAQPQGGKPISTEFLGIFFEDISASADGGINAELLQNGSFEFNANERDGWGPMTAWRIERPGHSLGTMNAVQQSPIHANNPNYMHVIVERVGHYKDYDGWTGYGFRNDGFNGISVKEGAKYDFSFFARGQQQKARVVLVGDNNKVLAEQTINVNNTSWDKYSCTLTASETCQKACLKVLFLEVGELDVDMMSLMPQDTYKGHGLRKDLCEALEALNPKFMRFPGGCIVHGGGDGFWNTYMWKTTIGPKETRKQQKNCWGYNQSYGLGYYEYFQLCEDMNMQPVPILPCGVSCQGANGGWGMWPEQAQDLAPMQDMDKWTQDALDLIEWANGDVNTTWGRKRAEQGHPEPFNLKYLGIGNEEKISEGFAERFKYMYERITKAHPEITIVGTAGPGSHPGNPDFDNGWKLAEEIGLPIIDEHYYEQNQYFLTSKQYDSYPRDRKTKVYLGEYAAKDKKLIDAVAEGLYLIHCERNADVVVMTSYAPLFARRDNTNWNPDLIYFDNERAYLTCSYYVQQMFGKYWGDYYYSDVVKFSKADSKEVDASCVVNSKKKEVYVKIANTGSEAMKATIDLARFKVKPNASVVVITGDKNAENNYDAQPIQPVETAIKAGKTMTYDVQPYSFTVLKLKM